MTFPRLRRAMLAPLVAAAITGGCDGLFAPAEPLPAGIGLLSPMATLTHFSAGDVIGGQVMPRSGTRITLPLRFHNYTDDTLLVGTCPVFTLVDETTDTPLRNKCASVLYTAPAVAPGETWDTSLDVAVCDVAEEDFHTVDAHNCFYRSSHANFDGRFRVHTVVGPRASLGSFEGWKSIRSPAFLMMGFSLDLQ